MTDTVALAFDLSLAAGIVALAAALLFGRRLFTSAVLFVAFGLLVTVAWVRLQAPDVALAEAAVGAGLTGALIMRAAGQMPAARTSVPVRPLAAITTALLTTTLFAVLLSGLMALPWPQDRLGQQIRAETDELGLEQPVTGVLLVFRGYDTWLEIGVMVTAVLALLGIRPARRIARHKLRLPRDPLLSAVVRMLIPIAVLLGSYLLWQGTHHPGGAFQGGALVAAVLALAYLAGLAVFRLVAGGGSRLLLVAAFAAPTVLGAPLLVAGEPLLAYPGGDPRGWLLPLELVIGASTAFILAALFAGAEPETGEAG